MDDSGMILKTRRLCLRKITQTDFSVLASMLQDIEVMYAWEHAFSDDEVRGWIDRNIARYHKDGCGYWFAEDLVSGEVLGQAGVLREEIGGRSELGVGWIFRKAHWGKGYAAEAGMACLDYAFRKMNAGRVIADIRPENVPSIRVAEKLGMMRCGEYEKTVGDRFMTHRIFYARTPLITVSDYTPLWGQNFLRMKELLAGILESCGGRLEHVGSTSVPGLAAKPVIDADYILESRELWPEVKAKLESLGFFHRGDGGLPGREMFTESLKLDFRHNFYVCDPDSPHLANHLLLREFLMANPDAVLRYGTLKKELAERFPDDVDNYCAGKSDLLSEFLVSAGFDADSVESINRINKAFGLPQKS